LDYLNAHFRFGFVPGPIGSRRNDRDTVVLSQVAVGGIQIRLVIAGMRDGGLQIIRHHDLGHATEKLKCPDTLAYAAFGLQAGSVCEPVQLRRSCPGVASAKV
jgi:hypothetical protein